MNEGARLGTSKLTVALDVRHPLAFLALRPTIAFGRALQIDVDWLPMCAQPLRPPSAPQPEDDRGVRHKRHRAHMIAREIAVYAEAQGSTIEEPYRDTPADAANLAWLWMRDRRPTSLEPFLTELFRRYWALELDAGAADSVAEVVREYGAEAGEFLAWAGSEGPAAAESVAGDLTSAGIFTTPAYLVGDQVFYGRQHLPMIRWLLEGETGPAPI